MRKEKDKSSIGKLLRVYGCDEEDVYADMDWALARQRRSKTLLLRGMDNGTLVLDGVLGGV